MKFHPAFAAAALFMGFLTPAFSLAASDQVTISQITHEAVTLSKYKITGVVSNYSPEDRDLVLRAQIAFYRQDGMAGEAPEWILRKDFTRVVRSGDSQLIEVELMDDTGPPKGSFRRVPMLRIRRDREWKY